MKTSARRKAPAGFVSYVLVLSTGVMLTLLMVFAYRDAVQSQAIQAGVQLQIDYSEKEDTILRSVVSIAPNRAIRAMQGGSNTAGVREDLTWQSILTESLSLANAGQSLNEDLIATLGGSSVTVANPGNTSIANPEIVFAVAEASTAWARAGINQDFGADYPPPLSANNPNVTGRDGIYPIIADNKKYDALAQSGVQLPVETYPKFNLIEYPEINFGYASPGESFVAKRNWWTFNLNLAAQDSGLTGLERPNREFVLSIYEIPSQLAISAPSFMALGEFESGATWENVNIDGGVYGGRVRVDGETALPALASRRGMELSTGAVIGGQAFNGANPFTPGVREQFEVTTGQFFPLSMPSESGRAVFVPINRGAEFFDRFSAPEETVTLSPTTWNEYSVGANQCAMRLDVIEAVSSENPTPTVLRFSYIGGGSRREMILPQVTGIVGSLPAGFVKRADEHQTYDFGDSLVDVAYGANGRYYFKTNVSGPILFTNANFGDPIVGTFKGGYSRPAAPWQVKTLPSGKICIAVYPERMPAFLASIGADDTSVNHSLVVNVDYTASVRLTQPSIPTTEMDYGVILQECADLTGFTKGFSLVTNLRLYFGDDLNIVPTTPPAGYTPPDGQDYYPPFSSFSPEKRYGVELDPFAVRLTGQLGSLAGEDVPEPVRPLETVGMSGSSLAANRIHADLRQIRHPAELPPITMMNWLVVLEERRREFSE